MGHGQGRDQARPLDVVEQWKMARLQSSFPVFPGFSCQFLKEDDEHERLHNGESSENAPQSAQPEQPTLFRAST